jgi:hypothetical protein
MVRGLRNRRRGPAEAGSSLDSRGFRPLAGLLPAVAALLLAGCAGAQRPVVEAAAVATPAVPASTGSPEALAPAAGPAAPPAPPRPTEPEDVLGLPAEDLEKLLGRPAMVRRDEPAEVWQYRSESCVVDLYLYPERSAYRVAYIEARDRFAASVTARSCLGSLAKPAI